MLKSSSMNDTTVRPFHVRAGKSGIRHPAHFYVLSGGLLGNVWGSGWRRWWWLRKIDLLSVPFSFKIIFSIPISRCFSIIFLWQMNKWVAPKPRRLEYSESAKLPLPWTILQFRPFMYAQVLRKCRALVGIVLVLVFQPCECAAGPVCYGVSSWICFRLRRSLASLLLLFWRRLSSSACFSVCCGCRWILVSIRECAASL